MRISPSQGPYAVGEERHIGDDTYFEIVSPVRGVVALVDACHEGGESVANARLFAAAEEMLDALLQQEMAEADSAAARRKGYFDLAMEMRKAAIAKASILKSAPTAGELKKGR